MGVQRSLQINLADPDAVSDTTVVANYRSFGATIFPNEDTSYALGSGVATMQFSTDGENFVDSSFAISNSTQGKFAFDITSVHTIRFKTSTADGSADPAAEIAIYMQ
jgi:hypothetical protein